MDATAPPTDAPLPTDMVALQAMVRELLAKNQQLEARIGLGRNNWGVIGSVVGGQTAAVLSDRWLLNRMRIRADREVSV